MPFLDTELYSQNIGLVFVVTTNDKFISIQFPGLLLSMVDG